MTTGDERTGEGSGLPLPAPEEHPADSPPPARRRARIAVTALGGALVLLGILALAGGLTSDSPSAVAVGDCVSRIELPTTPAAPTPVSETLAEAIACGDDEAVYRVAVSLDGEAAACPSPIYRVYREVGGPSDARTLCLTYNVGEGECFVETPLEAGRFDCSTGPRLGAIKILRLVSGVTDPQQCADIDEPAVIPAVIPEPAMTFCYTDFTPGSPGEVPRSA